MVADSCAGGPGTPDRDGFEAFYAATRDRTYQAARRVAAGDHQVAIDAMHDAYVVMLRRWPERSHRSLSANHNYVVRIAANKIIDGYRGRDRQTSIDDTECDPPAEEDPIGDLLDELSVFRAVCELIDRQPPRRRAVATLFFLEEMNCPEIAAALGITESTIRTHVERMRKLLKPLIYQISRMDEGGAGHA